MKTKKRGKYLATRYKYIVRYPANDIYYLYWKHKGKRYEYSLQTNVEAQALINAEKEIVNIKARLASGIQTVAGKITLGDLLTRFMVAQKLKVEKREIKESSYNAINDGVKKISREKPQWIAREASKIPYAELDEYVTQVIKTQSPTTVNKVVDALKRSYSMGIEEYWVAVNPTAKLKRASIHGVKAEEVPSEEQYQAMLKHFSESKNSLRFFILDMVEFLANFGPRIKEARHVLKADVDVPNRQITFRETKNGKKRIVPIFENTVRFIERLLSSKRLHRQGKALRPDHLLPIIRCDRALKRAAKAVGIPFRVSHHTLRHLCATRWVEKGVNVKQVAKWLGHLDGGKLVLGTYTTARDAQDKIEAAKVSGSSVIMDAPIIIGGVAYTKAQLETMLSAAKNVVPLPAVA